MLQVLGSAWALLLGLMLLMVGNGMQGTLLGLRGAYEGFSTFNMSLVMSAYFVGFLGGSRLAPEMIRRVGHVRVFAALASLISGVLILYPAITTPWAWMLGRVAIGFCFSAVYVTAESWLNNTASNETRGQAMSLYMIVQTVGIIIAQLLVNVGDISGYLLFVIPSILVSVSFTPILLSISPTPAFETTKPMTLRKLYGISPLGCVGMLLSGGLFAAQFGMASVFGTMMGLTTAEISIFISSFFVGALVLQYPIGWLSDRMDRRVLILALCVGGGTGGLVGLLFASNFTILLVAAVTIGGMLNPLYALLLAYTNDYLEFDDMAAASSGMIFINGFGAIAGPVVTGWVMNTAGPAGFFLIILVLFYALAAYAGYRMTQRSSPPAQDTMTYTPFSPTATAVGVEVSFEAAHEAQEQADSDIRN
ncbi:MFS transporter [Donghicola tyrosinivorans]|uniref:Putative MFS family arabinose efflux permease n=1 Tax=Donghicola tyrosinivorans TaxID=1652492 RepID=A0A2T0X597_9RHOB|nr:MFS transporter [Donghicola tyrosinivorans]PRY94111.1 putative MFS family arabinose efflux permease [Donghicola tyrosinivorans]